MSLLAVILDVGSVPSCIREGLLKAGVFLVTLGGDLMVHNLSLQLPSIL